jgi:hypothetical protein
MEGWTNQWHPRGRHDSDLLKREKKMMTLVLFLLLPQGDSRFHGHPVQADQGQLTIHLHGLPTDADWVLGVTGIADGPSTVTVADLQATNSGFRDLKTAKNIDDWGPHLRTQSGVVDFDGLGGIKGVLLIHFNLPQGTQVAVYDDGPTVINTGTVQDSLHLHEGVVVARRVASPQDLMNTALSPELARPDKTAVAYVQPLGNGLGFVSNMKAIKEHALTMPVPAATTTDGWVTARMTITAAGTIGKIDFTTGSPELRAAVSQAAQGWTFTPFREGEVVVPIIMMFKGGMVHSALWD